MTPGRRQLSVNFKEAANGFDQTETIEGQFAAWQTRRLLVAVKRVPAQLWRRRLELRWLD